MGLFGELKLWVFWLEWHVIGCVKGIGIGMEKNKEKYKEVMVDKMEGVFL